MDETTSRATNHTFITLIPKRATTNKVEHFRPIALCNVIYKLVTNVIAMRLKAHLNDIIHPAQSTFIPTRSILDNGIINHEVMNYMNSKKGKIGFVAVKVDMAKAYDRVEWDVLIIALAAHGFN